MTIDWVTPLNSILATAGVLVTVIATWFVNRWLRRRAARDAIEEAIVASVALTKDAAQAASYVQTLVPEQMKTLGVEPPELRERIERRVNSRSIVI